MKFLGKILLYGLPTGLEKALLQQFEAIPDVVTGLASPTNSLASSTNSMASPATESTSEAPDLVIYADGGKSRPPLLSPGTPGLPVDLARRSRLGVILRQARQMLEEPSLHLDDFRLGSYMFRPQEKILAAEGKEDIALTDKEADILVYLAKRAGTVSRDDLLKHVWRYQEGVDTHTLETHIYRLRQKIEASAENPALLVTDEGGYRLIT